VGAGTGGSEEPRAGRVRIPRSAALARRHRRSRAGLFAWLAAGARRPTCEGAPLHASEWLVGLAVPVAPTRFIREIPRGDSRRSSLVRSRAVGIEGPRAGARQDSAFCAPARRRRHLGPDRDARVAAGTRLTRFFAPRGYSTSARTVAGLAAPSRPPALFELDPAREIRAARRRGRVGARARRDQGAARTSRPYRAFSARRTP
jgi:hypothetical protein